MSFSIEKLNYEQDGNNLLEFFKKVYSPKHTLTDKVFFEWQFVRCNFTNLIGKQDGRIIGHQGVIHPSFIINGQIRRVGFLTSLMITPEWRNGGLGVFLNRELEKRMDALCGTGFNQDGIKLFRNLGWTDAGNMYRWVLKIFKQTEHQARDIFEFNDEWNKSWEQIKKRFVATTDRTSQYLNWRFINHPRTKYQVLGVKNQTDYDGYIILRLEEGEIRAARIVDLIAGNEQVEKELLKAAINYAHENKVDFLDFFCTSKIYAESFKSLDFNDADSETPVFILPIDNNRKYINWAYKIISPELQYIKKEDWFVVKADGDKDRPQNISR